MCSLIDDAFKVVDNYDEQPEVISTATLSRRDIRSLIFHVLYAAESHDYEESIEAITENLSKGFSITITPDSDVITTASQVIELRDSLDDIYKPLLTNWRFDRISVSIKLILRLAVWELLYTTTDQKIVINEAVELAKCFAEEDAYRFINGILDGVARKQNQTVESDSDVVTPESDSLETSEMPETPESDE